MSEPCNKSSDIDVMKYRLEHVEQAIGEISGAVKTISDSITKMVGIEQLHGETQRAMERAFDEIAKLQTKDKEIEKAVVAIQIQLPLLQEGVKWIKAGVLAVVVAVFGAAGKIIFWV